MMATSATRAPTVLYAQDKKNVFLTVDIQDVVEPKITTTATSIAFEAQKDNITYKFDIELFADVKPESWNTQISNRNIKFVVEKQDTKAKFWNRLQKAPGKLAFVKTDFSKYQDEDEEQEQEPMDFQSGMNEQLMQMMAQGGGGQNADLMNMLDKTEAAVDSDDEEPTTA